VQTFLPDDVCERNACPLDAERLGKQPVEAIQVVRAITVPGYEWASHSAALSGGASIRVSGCVTPPPADHPASVS
jgi:hypothetical protein